MNALYKVAVKKCFSLVVYSTYPIKKSDFVTEIMIKLHNCKKKIIKKKCHETHICPATQVPTKAERKHGVGKNVLLFASATPPSNIRFIP